jgi:predicted  nucleic acid-binding Zn-ribbon protein
MRNPAEILDDLRDWWTKRQARRPYLRRLEGLKVKRSTIVGNLQELAGRIRSLREEYAKTQKDKERIDKKISETQEKLDGIQ